MKGLRRRLSQQAGEAEGSLTPEARGRVGAALTTTGRAGTARRLGSGKQGGKVYASEPALNAPQVHRLQPGGYGPDCSARPTMGGRLRSGLMTAGGEATGKACGVPVARLQGHSWAPIPPIGPW